MRDGKKAITLAKKACGLTDYRNMLLVETLAAAYAESGDFEKAVETQKKVLNDDEYMKKWEAGVKQKLKLYEESKPYHTARSKAAPPAHHQCEGCQPSAKSTKVSGRRQRVLGERRSRRELNHADRVRKQPMSAP